jgi:hypothetical protein
MVVLAGASHLSERFGELVGHEGILLALCDEDWRMAWRMAWIVLD